MADKVMSMRTSIIRASKPHLKKFWYYAKVELAPPKPSDIPAAVSGFTKLLGSAKSGAWKNLTVKQAFLNTLVGAEILGWFFIGECIGKRNLIGYDLR